MIIRANLLRIFLCLLLVPMFAGCVSPGQRTRYLQQIEPGSLTNLVAYRAGTNLDLRFPLHVRDAFAHASWPKPPDDASGYHYQVAEITFEKQEFIERTSIVRRGNRLPIRGPRQWQQLLQGVFRNLAPSQTNHGVIVLIQNQEMVVFHDAAGKLDVVQLEHKSPDVVVDQTFNSADFSREAIQLLEAQVSTIDTNQTQFLFVTGEDPDFVLIDLSQHLLVFLSYPADPETHPMEVPGMFAVRAVNSLVIKSFLIAAIKNPFTLVSRGLWHFGNSGATVIESGSTSPSDPIPPLYTGPGMDLSDWETNLDKIISERRYQGKLDLLIDGERFFPALIQSIEAATNTVDILVFIFDNDDYAVKIADLLKRRSSAVRVRVLMDGMGSLFAAQSPPRTPAPPDFQPPADIRSYLKSNSRVRVRISANPWLTGDHRKCIIIDGRQAFIGGMNIGREYRSEWHDMMVGLTGPIVGRLERDYRLAWAHAGPLGDFAYAWASLFDRLNPQKIQIDNPIDIRPLRTATGRTEIFRSQLEAVRRSKSYIYIENPYFQDASLLRAMIEARRRGVDVRVILPGENDNGIMETSNLITANELVKNGIRVYAYPGMTHLKAAIYDGWACLGSANFEKMSLRVSQELDIAFSDPDTVNRLRHDLFETDFNRSRELKGPVPLNWLDFLVKAFADQL